MTCGGVKRALTEDLQRVDESEIQAHIRGCEACAKLYRDLHAIEKLTPYLLEERVEIPTEFAARVHGRVSVGSAAHTVRRPVLCISGILLLAFGLVSIWQQPGGPATTLASQAADLHEREGAEQERSVRDAQPAHRQQAAPQGEIILRGTSQPETILRLPSQIRVRSTTLHDDFYLNHASY